MKRLFLSLIVLLLLLAAPTALAVDDAPHEHVFGEWYTVTAATCTALGEERRDCETCDAFETRDIPMQEHAFGEWYTVTAATCTALGEERRDCETCDAFETRDIPMQEHAFGEWYTVTEATCIEAGEERRDCANCDGFETQEIPMREHTFGDWETVTAPDCLHRGEAKRVCESCELEETMVLQMLGHSFVEDPYVAPTCTTAGRTQGEHCERCGAVLFPGPTTLKPLGHFLDEHGDCKVCGEHIKDLCPYCGKDHDGQLFGGFIAWLHSMLLRLRALFQG